jgi:hypothetical protein
LMQQWMGAFRHLQPAEQVLPRLAAASLPVINDEEGLAIDHVQLSTAGSRGEHVEPTYFVWTCR